MNDNWTSKNPPPELSDTDAELLSAYIDNMLDAGEVTALEARLVTDAFLRSELAAMRQMLGWLKTMPQLKAPRNFTISEADVKPITPKIIPMPRRNSWQFASAAAAIVLVLFGFVAFYSLNQSPSAESSQVAAAPTQGEQDEAEESPLVDTSTSTLLMATAGVPPSLGGNSGSGSSTGSGGGEPLEAQEASTSGEVNDLARTSDSGDTDFGADSEPQPLDVSVEAAIIELTSTMAADGQLANTSFAMPTGTANAVTLDAFGTSTSAPTATATPQSTLEIVAEESITTSVQQDAIAESTEVASIMMTAPIDEESESDDASSANIAIGSTAVNKSDYVRELLRGILQRLLDDIR